MLKKLFSKSLAKALPNSRTFENLNVEGVDWQIRGSLVRQTVAGPKSLIGDSSLTSLYEVNDRLTDTGLSSAQLDRNAAKSDHFDNFAAMMDPQCQPGLQSDEGSARAKLLYPTAAPPHEVLRFMARSTNIQVRRVAARNPQTPKESMWNLSLDEDIEVRRLLAANHRVPLSILHVLMEDKDRGVVENARAGWKRVRSEVHGPSLETPMPNLAFDLSKMEFDV